MNATQFKAECSKLAIQTLRSMGTAKFYILISSSFFFWIDKLDQTSWLSAVLTVAGLTQASSIAEILRGKKDETVVESSMNLETIVTQSESKVKNRVAKK